MWVEGSVAEDPLVDKTLTMNSLVGEEYYVVLVDVEHVQNMARHQKDVIAALVAGLGRSYERAAKKHLEDQQLGRAQVWNRQVPLVSKAKIAFVVQELEVRDHRRSFSTLVAIPDRREDALESH